MYLIAFNTVVDRMLAGKVAGQPLAGVTEVYVGEYDAASANNFPYIWVHPDEPPITEEWTGAQRVRDGEHRILVKMAVNGPDPSAAATKYYPLGCVGGGEESQYSGAAVKGPYSWAGVLLNYLEGITWPAASKVYRYTVTVVAVAALDKARQQWGIVVRLTLSHRFQSGGR